MIIARAEGITKRFPGVVALEDVTVEFAAGSCHALMGENGAGKSTLGKILGGLYAPDAGQVILEGQQVRFRGPREADAEGVSIIHQELLFAENLTVADNLCLGDLPARGVLIDEARMLETAREYLGAIGSDIDPRTRLGELTVSRQQLVQIAAGVGRGAKVLVFDEPTSSLSQVETERLLVLIAELKQRGIACIYVSHRLEEVFRVCDTVTVLRDGRKVDTRPISELDRNALVSMMVGRPVSEEAFVSPGPVGEVKLSVDRLTSPGKFRDISFEVRAGEILGLAGLVGAGRTEVVEALFGLDPHVSGTVQVNGKSLHGGPVERMELGLGLVPEDRKRHGLVLGMNARENISLPILDRLAAWGLVKLPEERSLAQKFFDRMRVKAPSLDAPTQGLSGGNQQKLVIAKWLAAETEILLVDEPTRGVDVGAKAEIHDLLRGLAADGKAVIVVSSDLPELLGLATRILVMREGSLAGELPAAPGEQAVMRLMAGVG